MEYITTDSWPLGFEELRREYVGNSSRTTCPLAAIYDLIGKEILDISSRWVLRIENGKRLYFKKIRAATEEDKVCLVALCVWPGEIIYLV